MKIPIRYCFECGVKMDCEPYITRYNSDTGKAEYEFRYSCPKNKELKKKAFLGIFANWHCKYDTGSFRFFL